jgi:hypothetical protein
MNDNRGWAVRRGLLLGLLLLAAFTVTGVLTWGVSGALGLEAWVRIVLILFGVPAAVIAVLAVLWRVTDLPKWLGMVPKDESKPHE